MTIEAAEIRRLEVRVAELERLNARNAAVFGEVCRERDRLKASVRLLEEERAEGRCGHCGAVCAMCGSGMPGERLPTVEERCKEIERDEARFPKGV